MIKVGLEVFFRGEVKPMDATVTYDQEYWLNLGLPFFEHKKFWFRKRREKYGALITERTARMNWRHTYRVFDYEGKRRIYKHYCQFLDRSINANDLVHWFEPEVAMNNTDDIEQIWRTLNANAS